MDPGPLPGTKGQRWWQPYYSYHSIVVLFWCHRMQILELSFFSDGVITSQRPCVWGATTSLERISLLCFTFKFIYFLRIGNTLI